MVLKIVDESTTPATFKNIPIAEGEMYLLSARIPHSPQRFANTIGIVIERQRTGSNAVNDAMRWYCEKCKVRMLPLTLKSCFIDYSYINTFFFLQSVIYEEEFMCADVATQLKTIIGNFHASDKICKSCGHQNVDGRQE